MASFVRWNVSSVAASCAKRPRVLIIPPLHLLTIRLRKNAVIRARNHNVVRVHRVRSSVVSKVHIVRRGSRVRRRRVARSSAAVRRERRSSVIVHHLPVRNLVHVRKVAVAIVRNRRVAR